MKNLILFITIIYSLTSPNISIAGEGHDHGHEEEGHSEAVKIPVKTAAESGIEVLTVEPKAIQSFINVTGSITLNPNSTAKVKARYAGIIKSITKSVGEKVTAGETLATVEANESLQVYAIKSPISGIVMERNLNIGDAAAEEPIMIIADTTKLQAEFYIFAKDAEKITQGQNVIIRNIGGSLTANSTLSAILPFAENSSQTIVARAIIDNPENKWKPGFTIKADIAISEKQAAVAVKASAIQKFEGEDVVFVNERDSFEKRPVKIGASNNEWVEITSGLEQGEAYAANGSFVIKAELGKSSAEHSH